MSKVMAFAMRDKSWAQQDVWKAMSGIQASSKAPRGGKRPPLPFVDVYPEDPRDLCPQQLPLVPSLLPARHQHLSLFS